MEDQDQQTIYIQNVGKRFLVKKIHSKELDKDEQDYLDSLKEKL
jgi:hypothetical protein